MSDNSKNTNSNNSSTSCDNFSRQIARIAVAQICESTGFNCANLSALDTFTEIAIKYISQLGKTAHFYSNLANRTSCNEFDIIQALEDLNLSHGFANASNTNRCLLKSGVVKELTEFVSLEKEVAFARSIPKYPVKSRVKNRALSFAQIGEESGKKHVPDWLPAFPDPHTYIHTPVWNEREVNTRDAKVEQAKKRRKAEKSLLNLQQRLASCNGAVEFGNVNEESNEKGKNVVGESSSSGNPFLAPALPAGEKDVTEIGPIENEKKVTVLETFEPVIEAAKKGCFESKDNEKKLVLKQRPVVKFKFGIGKKSMEMPLNSKAFGGKNESWFLRDDERDEKKQRAEKIMKKAMENPHELAQL